MTGYTVNTGSTVKYSEGWDQIFGASKPAPAKPTKGKKPSPAAKKANAASAVPEQPRKKSTGAKKQTKKAAQTARSSGKP